MVLVEAITLLLWVLLGAFAVFCFLAFGVVAINVFCVIMLAVVRLKKRVPKFKVFDLVFAPAIWAMSKMEEEK